MRPAGNPLYRFVLKGKALIGTIAIRLQDAFKPQRVICFMMRNDLGASQKQRRYRVDNDPEITLRGFPFMIWIHEANRRLICL